MLNYMVSVNQTIDVKKAVETVPPVVDYSVRVVFLLVHIMYIVIVLLNKDLQRRSLVQMHHTNIIGLITGIHYCIWIAWVYPNTTSPFLDNLICRLSEALWATCKYARCYSILGD